MMAPNDLQVVSQPTKTLWSSLVSSFMDPLGFLGPRPHLEEPDLSKDTDGLRQFCRTVCKDTLEQLKYPGAPVLKAAAVEVLLEHMHRRAVDIGVSLETKMSAKAFRQGFSEGLVRSPEYLCHFA